jgi:metal-sulfur cluster biosynthetic enzyme
MSAGPGGGLRGPVLNAVVGAPLVDHVVVRPGTERYWRALKEVRDPELPISVVDMGLIHDIRRDRDRAGRLDVTMTFTATACPCMELMLMDVRDRLLKEEGVRAVAIEVVWDPPWTRDMITEEGRATLRRYGVAA